MSAFYPQQDDLKKVIPIRNQKDSYKPYQDDIPVEELTKRQEQNNLTVQVKSGTTNRIDAPIILRFPVENEARQRLSGQIYRIILPSGKVLCGETDGQGILKETIHERGCLSIEMQDGSSIMIETA